MEWYALYGATKALRNIHLKVGWPLYNHEPLLNFHSMLYSTPLRRRKGVSMNFIHSVSGTPLWRRKASAQSVFEAFG